MMELVLALAIGVLSASGVWLLLRPRTFQVIMGLSLLSYAVNLLLLASGRLVLQQPPVLEAGRAHFADPIPQALVLTAIVIGFGMTAFLIVLALRARAVLGSDHVDGVEPGPSGSASPGETPARG